MPSDKLFDKARKELARIDKEISKLKDEQNKLPIERSDLSQEDFIKAYDVYNKLDDQIDVLEKKKNVIKKRIESLSRIDEFKSKNKEKEELASNYEEAIRLIVSKYKDLLNHRILPNIPNEPKFEQPLFKVAAYIQDMVSDMRSFAAPYERNKLSKISILMAPAIYEILSKTLYEGLQKNDDVVEANFKVAFDIAKKIKNLLNKDKKNLTEEEKQLLELRKKRTKVDKEIVRVSEEAIKVFIPEMAKIATSIPEDKKLLKSLLKKTNNITKTVFTLTKSANKFSKKYPNGLMAVLAFINLIKSVEIALKAGLGKNSYVNNHSTSY